MSGLGPSAPSPDTPAGGAGPDLVLTTADGYRVVVLDLLGYGASERPADPQVDTSVSAQVDLVLAVLTAHGVESAHIVAHDIGGGVAQRLGVLYPGRMRSLVLIDSVSFDSWPSERTRRQMRAGLDALIAAPPDAHRAHVREWLLSTVVDDAVLADGALDHYLDIITGPSVRPASISIRLRTTTPATPTNSRTASLSWAACPCI